MLVSQQDYQAVEASIRLWQKAQDQLSLQGIEPQHMPSDCPLCVLHNHHEGVAATRNCLHCPFYRKTGARYCRKTPFHLWDQDRSNPLKHAAMIAWMQNLLEELQVEVENPV